VIKDNTGTLALPGDYSFTGTLTARGGTTVLTGTGTQSATVVSSDGILQVGNAAALGSFAPLTVNPNNAGTGRLELSNNITVQTFQDIAVSMRNTQTPAIVNVSGNNTLADAIAIQAGGGVLGIEAAAGTSLELAGGVTSLATGNRNFTLRGEGTGVVSGLIQNGSASAVTLNKADAGTWTLTSPANSFTGDTVVSDGILRLGAGGTLAWSARIDVDTDGQLDASPAGGLALSSIVPQTLRGRGVVAGDVSTFYGTVIEVGYHNQYGTLSLSNNLTLGGDDVLRFDLSTATNDILEVAGSLTLNGTTTNAINVPEGFVDNGTYRLINYTGVLQGLGSFELLPPASRQIFTLDTSTPGQVNLVVTGNPTNLVWSGDGFANVWDVGATANWNNQTEVFYNADNARFDDTGSATPDITVSSPVIVSSLMASNETKDFTFVGDFGIASLGTLTKQGAGTLTLANSNNAFSGPISIEAGTLQVGNGLTDVGSLGSGDIDIAGAGTLAHNKTNAGTTLNGDISGAGEIRVLGGTLQLGGSNTFTGPATVEAGDITIRNNSALGDPATGTTVQPGGSVRVSSLGDWVIPEPLTLAGIGYETFPGALYVNTVSNNVVWTGPITLSSNSLIRVVNNYAQLILSNSVTATQQPLGFAVEGTGTRVVTTDSLSIGDEVLLTKTGNGTLVLAGPTNLSGGTVIEAGTLAIATTNPPAIGDITVNGGTLAIGDGGADASFPPGLINLVNTGSRLALNSSSDLTLSKEVGGLGQLAKQNTNTVTIVSSNSFAGNVSTGSGSPSNIGTSGGILRLENSYGLGDGNASKVVSLVRSEMQLTGGISLPAALTCDLSGGSFITTAGAGLIPIRSLSGNNTVEGPIRLIGGAGDSEIVVDSDTLTLNGQITDNTTSARRLYLSGAGTGVVNGALYNGTIGLALTKQGSGTWTLNGANFYTGTTLIQGGTLALGAAASIFSTTLVELRNDAVFDVSALAGGFTVDFSQTLSGNGTVQGNVIANGNVSPGLSVGTLNVTGSITLNGITTMELDRAGTPNADLLSAGSITLGGQLVVNNIGANLQGGEVFNLFDGTLSGSFAGNVILPALDYNPDLSWDTTQLETLGILKVAGGLPPQPTILPPTLSGTNLLVQVPSESGFSYVLEVTPSLAPATWIGIETNAGGGSLLFTIPVTPGTGSEFFRIRAE
jgi:autotransporter-associated beta strand protein